MKDSETRDVGGLFDRPAGVGGGMAGGFIPRQVMSAETFVTLLERVGWSQRALADASGFKLWAIRQMAAGACPVDPLLAAQLRAMSKAMGAVFAPDRITLVSAVGGMVEVLTLAMGRKDA